MTPATFAIQNLNLPRYLFVNTSPHMVWMDSDSLWRYFKSKNSLFKNVVAVSLWGDQPLWWQNEGDDSSQASTTCRLTWEGGRGCRRFSSWPSLWGYCSWLSSRKPWGPHSRKLICVPERCHSSACSGFQHVLHMASFMDWTVSPEILCWGCPDLQCDCAWR